MLLHFFYINVITFSDGNFVNNNKYVLTIFNYYGVMDFREYFCHIFSDEHIKK